MDDTPPPEDSKKEFNKLDLSQLQSFSFGTQWSQDKTQDQEGRAASGKFRESRGDDRPPRREGPGGGGNRPDRRSFKRPAGPPGGASGGERSGPPRGSDGLPRGSDGPPRERREGEDRRGAPFRGRERPVEHVPYLSPVYDVTFYPEDLSFDALAKTIRSSCRTFELFDIARTVVGKNDRFVVVVQAKSMSRPSGPAGAEPAPPSKPKFHLAVPDGTVFESEDAAVAHVMQHHLGVFFEEATVVVDPPKGSFQVINRCGVTGALLGPPNYHRYNQTVQQHHATHAARMPLEAYRARIESVRDEAVVAQWLDSQRTAVRYTLKGSEPVPATASAAETMDAGVVPAAAPAESPAVEHPAAEASAAEPAPTVEAEAPAAVVLNSLEDVRVYLLTHLRPKVVRTVDSARFHGKLLDGMPDGEIKRATIGALERQRRFPLDTANALRGRLRREGFTIFKKGSKGVSYVCAVKRKFRLPGQTFAESIGELIDFIESHPLIKASELPEKFLGLTPAAPATPPAEGAAVGSLSVEDQRRLARMQGDLRWLVMEGYVTEFMDGAVFAPPPLSTPKSPGASADDSDDDSAEPAPGESAESTPENVSVAEEASAAPATESPLASEPSVDTGDEPETKPAPEAGA